MHKKKNGSGEKNREVPCGKRSPLLYCIDAWFDAFNIMEITDQFKKPKQIQKYFGPSFGEIGLLQPTTFLFQNPAVSSLPTCYVYSVCMGRVSAFASQEYRHVTWRSQGADIAVFSGVEWRRGGEKGLNSWSFVSIVFEVHHKGHLRYFSYLVFIVFFLQQRSSEKTEIGACRAETNRVEHLNLKTFPKEHR